ncbi:MAG: ABC transporter substrate-binding protein, partial [Methanosarcinales archaeon]|nr:ABC transporter substrate-binding protein [Methanosarcinales archaeon]
ANEDDTIDLNDVEYTASVILGLDDQTQLADAKYDGEVDILDMIQTELIILGKQNELTIDDGTGETVTVEMPVKRILVEYTDNAELVRILNAKDRVIAVDYLIAHTEIQFPELSKLPCIGNMFKPDYEAVLNVNPDLLLTFSNEIDEKKEKLPDTAVVHLGLYYPDLFNPEESQFTNGVRKLGYLLNAIEAAVEYINWRIALIDDIRSRTQKLSEGEKPRVFICSYGDIIAEKKTFRTYAMIDTLTQMSIAAGGKNIAEDLPEFAGPKNGITVDSEWVIEKDPEFIIIHAVRYTWGGSTMEPSHGYDEDNPSGMKEHLIDQLISRPEMANVTAVKTGNVYVMSGNFRNDATGGSLGSAYMARLFHPDLFANLDPEAIHQEYLTDFQGLDYDLNEHGVFVYPPIEINSGLAGIPDRYREE